jgi:hypothetical protein
MIEPSDWPKPWLYDLYRKLTDSSRWPQQWLCNLETEVIHSRSPEEARAAWNRYAAELEALEESDWEVYHAFWCHLTSLARIMFSLH